jgi:hypothetical protein
MNSTQPKWTIKSTQQDNYLYNTFAIVLDQLFEQHSFLSHQMSVKAGLKMFGHEGAVPVMKELKQLIVMDVIKACFAHKQTQEQKRKALWYLMFIKEKRCGCIKGQGCANSCKQCIYKTKEETSSPTVSVEALFLSCIVDALQGHDVGTCDIPWSLYASRH